MAIMTRPAAMAALSAALLLGACGGGVEDNSANNQVGATPRPTRNQAAPSSSRADNRAAGNDTPAPTPTAMMLDPEGLSASEEELGTSGRLRFGTAADLAVEIVGHILGASPTSDVVTAACGPEPTRVVRWTAGFALVARQGRFLGWAVDRPPFAFSNGVAVASTLRQLGQAFPVSVSRQAGDTVFSVRDSSVGGTLAGLRGDARVLTLHAGALCDPDAQPAAPPAAPPPTAARRR